MWNYDESCDCAHENFDSREVQLYEQILRERQMLLGDVECSSQDQLCKIIGFQQASLDLSSAVNSTHLTNDASFSIPADSIVDFSTNSFNPLKFVQHCTSAVVDSKFSSHPFIFSNSKPAEDRFDKLRRGKSVTDYGRLGVLPDLVIPSSTDFQQNFGSSLDISDKSSSPTTIEVLNDYTNKWQGNSLNWQLEDQSLLESDNETNTDHNEVFGNLNVPTLNDLRSFNIDTVSHSDINKVVNCNNVLAPPYNTNFKLQQNSANVNNINIDNLISPYSNFEELNDDVVKDLSYMSGGILSIELLNSHISLNCHRPEYFADDAYTCNYKSKKFDISTISQSYLSGQLPSSRNRLHSMKKETSYRNSSIRSFSVDRSDIMFNSYPNNRREAHATAQDTDSEEPFLEEHANDQSNDSNSFSHNRLFVREIELENGLHTLRSPVANRSQLMFSDSVRQIATPKSLEYTDNSKGDNRITINNELVSEMQLKNMCRSDKCGYRSDCSLPSLERRDEAERNRVGKNTRLHKNEETRQLRTITPTMSNNCYDCNKNTPDSWSASNSSQAAWRKYTYGGVVVNNRIVYNTKNKKKIRVIRNEIYSDDDEQRSYSEGVIGVQPSNVLVDHESNYVKRSLEKTDLKRLDLLSDRCEETAVRGGGLWSNQEETEECSSHYNKRDLNDFNAVVYDYHKHERHTKEKGKNRGQCKSNHFYSEILSTADNSIILNSKDDTNDASSCIQKYADIGSTDTRQEYPGYDRDDDKVAYLRGQLPSHRKLLKKPFDDDATESGQYFSHASNSYIANDGSSNSGSSDEDSYSSECNKRKSYCCTVSSMKLILQLQSLLRGNYCN